MLLTATEKMPLYSAIELSFEQKNKNTLYFKVSSHAVARCAERFYSKDNKEIIKLVQNIFMMGKIVYVSPLSSGELKFHVRLKDKFIAITKVDEQCFIIETAFTLRHKKIIENTSSNLMKHFGLSTYKPIIKENHDIDTSIRYEALRKLKVSRPKAFKVLEKNKKTHSLSSFKEVMAKNKKCNEEKRATSSASENYDYYDYKKFETKPSLLEKLALWALKSKWLSK